MTSSLPMPFRVVPVEDFRPETLKQVGAALQAIRPPELRGDLALSSLPGGASNCNFLLTDPDGVRSVLRIAAGLEHAGRFGLDRWRGLDAHRIAERAGVAPRILGITLPHGHSIVAFADEPVVDESRIRQPGILESCARALRQVHHAGVMADRFCPYFEVTRFVEIARAEALSMPDDIEDLVGISGDIRDLFEDTVVPDRLCHNDVQLPNFLSGVRTWILDWEYAAQGNPYFDLAMIASNADLDEIETREMLRAYFGEWRETDVARIRLKQVQSSLREATWSVIAEPVLDTGWEFGEWGQRLLLQGASDQPVGGSQGADGHGGPANRRPRVLPIGRNP